MTVVYFDEDCIKHKSPPGHPERPERLVRAWKALNDSGVLKNCTHVKPKPISFEAIDAIHDPSMAKKVQALVAKGGGSLDADTYVSSDSLNAGFKAAGAASDAVDAVLSGKHPNAFCLVRPPGHHATPKRSMGFCLFNNIALAAKR